MADFGLKGENREWIPEPNVGFECSEYDEQLACHLLDHWCAITYTDAWVFQRELEVSKITREEQNDYRIC